MRNHLPVGAIRQQQLWNNIHCALLTGSPSLPSPWRLLTEAGVLLGSGVFFLPFTEKGEIPYENSRLVSLDPKNELISLENCTMCFHHNGET